MLYHEAVKRLRVLPQPLPAPPTELKPTILAGPPRLTMPLEEVRTIPSAVLVLIVPGVNGEARVILTEPSVLLLGVGERGS